MNAQDSNSLCLSDAERDAVRRAVTDTIEDVTVDFEKALSEASSAAAALPKNLYQSLLTFRERSNADGVLFIRNLPQPTALGPTPSTLEASLTSRDHLSEHIILAIATLFGSPVGYKQEKNGAILQSLFPTPSQESKQASGSSKVDLEFHTELAFHPFSPDYVILLGLRQDREKEAKTYFCGVRRLLPHLTSTERDLLRQPLYRTGIDFSFGNRLGESGGGPLLPVLYGDENDPYFRFDLDLMVGETDEAQRVLTRLLSLVSEEKRYVRIEPGSLVVLDNRRCVHGRSTFLARYDGQDRWLLRLSVVQDIQKSLCDRPMGGRVISTEFTERLLRSTTSSTTEQKGIVELRNSRLAKLEYLEQRGHDCYQSGCRRSHSCESVLEAFPGNREARVCLAGRLMSWRRHGGITFGHLQDDTGRIQLLVRREQLSGRDGMGVGLSYEELDALDIGDIVEGEGEITATKKGEISVDVTRLTLLTKTLRPLPDKWSGLQDKESLLRRRFLATTTDPQSKIRFRQISAILHATRSFLHSEGFVEFLTPVLQPQYGGGSARPFVTSVHALDLEMYLAISHELYLKRLIVGGFEKVYTIGRYFRNEGIDRTHQPEFSMLETMSAYNNYEDNMDFIEKLFVSVALNALGRTEFRVRGETIELRDPWKRISMSEAVESQTKIDFLSLTSTLQAQEALHKLRVSAEVSSVGEALVEAFEQLVRPKLLAPTIVFGHPVEVSPLARPMRADPRLSERFELFIGGMEMSENWTELTDPRALFQRWKHLGREVGDAGQGQRTLDYDFLEVLEHGLPPTSGIGPGIERMAMLFCEADSIDDVVFFPLMKPRLSEENRAIFGVDDSAGVRQLGSDLAILSPEELLAYLEAAEGLDAGGVIVVRPFLRRLARSRRSDFLASGYVRITGVDPDRSLLVTGLQIHDAASKSIDQTVREFGRLVVDSVTDQLSRAFPARKVVTENVEWASLL